MPSNGNCGNRSMPPRSIMIASGFFLRQSANLFWTSIIVRPANLTSLSRIIAADRATLSGRGSGCDQMVERQGIRTLDTVARMPHSRGALSRSATSPAGNRALSSLLEGYCGRHGALELQHPPQGNYGAGNVATAGTVIEALNSAFPQTTDITPQRGKCREGPIPAVSKCSNCTMQVSLLDHLVGAAK
jgi:hypothetical protein